MKDKHISALWALAVGAWGVAFILVGIELAHPASDTDQIGLLIGMAAATLHVRSWFCSQAQRETEAFNLGREYEGSVRSLR